jgi:hypothetical protein
MLILESLLFDAWRNWSFRDFEKVCFLTHGGTGVLETLKMNLVFVTMEYAVALNFIHLSLIRKYVWFFCSIYYSCTSIKHFVVD